jgi:hypothetical protein
MGGSVVRLRKKSLPAGSGNPLGKAKNNFDSTVEIEKLFGPIEISEDYASDAY